MLSHTGQSFHTGDYCQKIHSESDLNYVANSTKRVCSLLMQHVNSGIIVIFMHAGIMIIHSCVHGSL